MLTENIYIYTNSWIHKGHINIKETNIRINIYFISDNARSLFRNKLSRPFILLSSSPYKFWSKIIKWKILIVKHTCQINIKVYVYNLYIPICIYLNLTESCKILTVISYRCVYIYI